MVISFTLLSLGVFFLCYQAKDEISISEKESSTEKEDLNIGLDDLFI